MERERGREGRSREGRRWGRWRETEGKRAGRDRERENRGQEQRKRAIFIHVCINVSGHEQCMPSASFNVCMCVCLCGLVSVGEPRHVHESLPAARFALIDSATAEIFADKCQRYAVSMYHTTQLRARARRGDACVMCMCRNV